MYRCLQIMVNLANFHLRDLMTYLVNLLMNLSVLGNFILLRFHSTLPFFMICFIVLATVFVDCCIISMYVAFGEIHALSTQTINAWKRNTNLKPLDRKLVLRYVKSFRANRYEMGTLGYFRRGSTAMVLQKIVFYTNKLLMTLR